MSRLSVSNRFADFLKRNSRVIAKRRRVLRSVGNKLHFVFFGSVDQHRDEHHVVRGFTASTTHLDSSYMIGSYNGYDVHIVDRSDIVKLPDNSTETHQWLVMELKAKLKVPHLFLVPKHHGATHYRLVFNGPNILESLKLHTHSPEFNTRYAVFGEPDQLGELEEVLSPEITQIIAAHFWPYAVEVSGNYVYIYSAEKVLTAHDVEIMLKNSAWLGQTLELYSSAD